MSDPYLGEIRIFAGTFAPAGWALCNGATLSISQNTALFSLLGTTYGGNGTSTFQIPNLQGRCVLGFGQLTGGTNYVQGTSAGTETVTLTTSNLPAHNHSFAQNVSDALANKVGVAGGIPAQVSYNSSGIPSTTKTAATGTYAAQNTGGTGGGQPTPVMQPYLVVNYIIALQGIYPSRS